MEKDEKLIEKITYRRPVIMSELTPEQLNAEIEKGYQQALQGKMIPLEEAFARLEEMYGISLDDESPTSH